MKKIQASQARAVVGGGFFKSLFKVSTGGLLLTDPVAGAVVTTGIGGAISRAIAKVAQR
jgi:hypothetical protein